MDLLIVSNSWDALPEAIGLPIRTLCPVDHGAKSRPNVFQRNILNFRLEYVQDESLYRYVYDFVEENRELWEKGVVVTREWEPAVTFVLSERRDGESYIGGIAARDFWCGKEIKDKLALPLSAAASIAKSCAWVFEGYNEGNQYEQRVSLGGATYG
jgi:hypothetical protein